MKKIILSIASIATLSTSAIAANDASESVSIFNNKSIVIRGGITGFSSDDTHQTIPGSVTGGTSGDKQDIGYLFCVGVEDDVSDNMFGTRQMITMSKQGDKTSYDGHLEITQANESLEYSYEVFYKLNQYFKPYVGIGAGLNRNGLIYDYDSPHNNDTDYINAESYDATAHAKLGVTGELIVGIEYFAEYKRVAGGSSIKVDMHRDILTGLDINADIENSLNVNVVTVGLGYRF